MCLRRYFSLMKQEQRKKQTARQLISLYQKLMEAPPGFEPGMEVLQTSALPLGDGADEQKQHSDTRNFNKKLERETGFEPATSTLARSHSTTELFPHTPKHEW